MWSFSQVSLFSCCFHLLTSQQLDFYLKRDIMRSLCWPTATFSFITSCPQLSLWSLLWLWRADLNYWMINKVSTLSFSWIHLKLTFCSSSLKFLMTFAGIGMTNEAEWAVVIVLKALNTQQFYRFDLKVLFTVLQHRNKNLENAFFTVNFRLILSVSFQFNFNYSDLVFDNF